MEITPAIILISTLIGEFVIPRFSLYVLISGLLVFGKDFSYIALSTPFTDIYISEIIIIFNIALIIIDLHRTLCQKNLHYTYWFMPIIIYGGFLAAIGFLSYGIFAVRQYAMLYYCVVAPIVYIRLKKKDLSRLLWLVMFSSLSRLLLHIIHEYVFELPLVHIESLSVNANLIVVIVIYYLINHCSSVKQILLLVILIVPYTHAILFPKVSLYIAYIVIMLMFICINVLRHRGLRISWNSIGRIASISVVIIFFSFHAANIINSKGRPWERFSAEMSSIVNPKFSQETTDKKRISDVAGASTNARGGIFLESRRAQRNNIHWRIIVWTEAFKELAKNPFFGKGFGSYFMAPQLKELKYDWEEQIDPHNSFLHVLMRTGVLGFFLFALPQVMVLQKTIIVVRLSKENQWRDVIPWIIMFASLAVICFFNVVLENPYGAVPYWFIIGVLLLHIDEVDKLKKEALKK